MYSHPHYLAFLREDGSDPPELPFRLCRLLKNLQRLLPLLEDVIEFGLGFDCGRLRGSLRMTTAIAHYYPEMTRQEMWPHLLESWCRGARV